MLLQRPATARVVAAAPEDPTMQRRTLLAGGAGWLKAATAVTSVVTVVAVAPFALAGCASNKQRPDADARPAWIDEPGEGVSASAGFHVRGRQAQEELAISRGRDELARRLGVRVDNEARSERTVVGDRSSSVSQAVSTQTVSDKEVKADVKGKWLDASSGTLWVWVVPVR